MTRNHYLLQNCPVLLEQLSKALAKSQGIFILGEIKNFGFFKGCFSESIVEKLSDNIRAKLQEEFPEYIFISVNEKYFAAIIPEIVEDQEEIIENIQRTLESSRFTDKVISLVTIFGISIFPQDSNIAEEIFNNAYLAVKNISSEDDNYYLYFHKFVEQQALFIKYLNMADELKSALKDNRIFLAFQPVVSSFDYKISYYECLLRMANNDNLLSIGEYIIAAEKFRFINIIDELMLELVVKELSEYPEISLSVNVSALGINNIAWMKKAKSLLQDQQISKRLIIEITETVAQKDFQKSIKFIKELQDLGCVIALDDFGSGYTSFSQLKILPIDIVKIDAVFVKDILTNDHNEFFVKSVVDLNKALKRSVVAEFVQTKEAATKLANLGVDKLQGYFFGEPTSTPPWRK